MKQVITSSAYSHNIAYGNNKNQSTEQDVPDRRKECLSVLERFMNRYPNYKIGEKYGTKR